MSALSLLGHAPTDTVSQLLQRDEPLPSRADVVIIGGGIMGCAAAWYLARQKLRVALLDRAHIASQQSGRNWGFVRRLCRDPLELPLAIEALRLWPGLAAELGHETGWRQRGCLFLSETQAEQDAFAAWHETAKDRLPDIRLLSPGETAARLPALSQTGHGAIFAADDGQAEPTLATLAFARAAERAGTMLLEECGAMRILTEGGKVCGVETEYGEIRAPAVICAAGAQSFRLLSGLGLSLPQKTVRSTVALSEPVPDLGLPCFVGLGLGLRQRPDGSCILATDAGTDIDVTLDSLRASSYFLREVLFNRHGFSLKLGTPFLDDLHQRLSQPARKRAVRPRNPDVAANLKRVKETQRLFARLFAGVAEPRIVKAWAGNIDVMPDALPVIDTPGERPGLLIATGFSGHGFGLGPAVGQALAALVQGNAPAVDLSPFAASRFEHGTYSRPYATI